MILIYSISFLSCEDNEIEIPPTEQAVAQLEGGVPEDKSIDINNDGQYDFEIKYQALGKIIQDGPPFQVVIEGRIDPLNDNHFFKQDTVLYRTNPFFEVGDTMKRNNNSNSTWDDYSVGAIYIDGRLIHDEEGDPMKTNEGWYKYEWRDNWYVGAGKTSDFFLGFKLKTNDPPKIGWMLLDFNIENGEISIIESKITDYDKLIIER